MVEHGGISAHVVVDGAELPEYASEYDEDSKKLKCWIPSEAGKEFTLRLKRETSDYYGETRFLVDGQCVLARTCEENSSLCSCSGLRNGVRSQRPLLFANTKISDDDALLGGSVPAEVGTISIEHWHIEKGGSHACKDLKRLFKPTGPVHERTKPVGHVTILGDERPCPKKRLAGHVKYVKHLITFVFQYRPQEFLRANGIVPRPKTEENLTLDGAKPISPLTGTPEPRGKKRKAPAVRDFIDLTEDDDGAKAHAGEGDDEEQAAIDDLKAELEIKRMELQLSKLERQKRKKAKLAGPSKVNGVKASQGKPQEKSKQEMVKEESV
ncbi:hypothetical protein CYLTODRAFT_426478 [Cylindrobasidium torrendii FP15055 ss-10]|uniref:DUF7918 domain-containing protein n=1 Tax=Cylindrobasidium torrendii FP15055 ss-10 TaxID=1314674 RepID=A0A0D7AXA9_9AGAR|nr:hypothetical protein CYLTODRAFT_426478 [Cylindrobasidium torrendii FP15055 ss-10]